MAFGNAITPGTLLGGVVGGIVGGNLGNFTGVSGGAIKNAVAEIGFNTLKGMATGAVGGGVGAFMDGGDVLEGAVNGARYGAIGGAVGSSLMIATFGATIKPSLTVQNKISEINDFFGISGSYAPVFRRGGLYEAVGDLLGTARGVTWGRNLVVPKNDYETYIHEYIHYIQQVKTGWGLMQGKGIIEQTRSTLSRIFGGTYNPYYVPGTNEFQARWWTNYFYRGGEAPWYYNGGFNNIIR